MDTADMMSILRNLLCNWLVLVVACYCLSQQPANKERVCLARDSLMSQQATIKNVQGV